MCVMQVDGSFEYEYTQQPTNAALPLANPQDFGPTYTAQELQALVYNVLTQDNSQQGSALATLQGLVANSADRHLFLLNGDVCYARGEVRLLTSMKCVRAYTLQDAFSP